MTLDWAGLETAVSDQLVGLVRQVRLARPTDRVYGAAVHELYAEQGGVIAWPLVGVGTEDALDALVATSLAEEGPGRAQSRDDLRWDTAAWTDQLDPGPAEHGWAAQVEAAAVAGEWEEVHDRFRLALVRGCRRARAGMLAEGLVDDEVVVVAMDEEWELVPLSLSAEQVRRHFPEVAPGT